MIKEIPLRAESATPARSRTLRGVINAQICMSISSVVGYVRRVCAHTFVCYRERERWGRRCVGWVGVGVRAETSSCLELSLSDNHLSQPEMQREKRWITSRLLLSVFGSRAHAAQQRSKIFAPQPLVIIYSQAQTLLRREGALLH